MITRNIVVVGAAAALVAAGIAGYALYQVGMNQGMRMASVSTASTAAPAPGTIGTDAAGASPKAADSSGRRVLYWHDPMTPGQKFDKPGKSPFMDMQLVPVYANDAGDEGKTIISPGVRQNLGMRTAEVARGRLETTVVAVGSVAYNDRDVALVQTRSGGFVERLHVRAPLDPVRKGQPLVELYMPEWIAAQEEFFSVRRMAARGMEPLVDGARQRMRLAGMSEQQVREVEAGGAVHPRFSVTAPIGGVVTELMVREGMTLSAGASLMRINGLGTIWVNAEVPEGQAAQVRPGVAVEASTPSVPGVTFKGKVSAIVPEVNIVTRTLKARIELANPSGRLLPGMFATVSFRPAAAREVLLVPTEAVILTGTRTVVLVEQQPGKFAAADVEIGAEANGQTEIRKGLEAGQKVVVSGQFLIDSEASLKSTISRLSTGTTSDAATAANANPSSASAASANTATMNMPGTAAATHHGEGRVERIDADEITLSHGPIPSLKWGAMTMEFKAPPGGVPKNVTVGSKVQFDMKQLDEGVYGITSIAPAATSPAQSAGKPDARAPMSSNRSGRTE